MAAEQTATTAAVGEPPPAEGVTPSAAIPAAPASGKNILPTSFLTKTYQMVDDPQVDDIISWSDDGNSFVLWRPAEIARALLPKYFKHNNLSSFVRQLNTFGFRKMTPDRWEFAHDCFRRGEKRLLCDIYRRKVNRRNGASSGESAMERSPSRETENVAGISGDEPKQDHEELMMTPQGRPVMVTSARGEWENKNSDFVIYENKRLPSNTAIQEFNNTNLKGKKIRVSSSKAGTKSRGASNSKSQLEGSFDREEEENCRPSFDLGSALSSPPLHISYFPFPPSLIACSQWEKGKCIGRGSFGHVFLGFNREHGQYCAIKEVLVISNDQRSKEQLKQLNQEIYLLKHLSHPNIVQYYGSDMTDSALSIYMEYVSKGSIHVLLEKGPFEESMIRSYTAQILSGVNFLHERKHIHRDIKGANILVGPNNEVKLADFGLAKQVQTLTAVHTSNTGTPYWMAPEVILSTYSDKGYNLSADIWSLGCTVIEMATGKPPLHGYAPIQAIFKIANDETYIPEIPDVLSDKGKNFLQLCLQRDPKSRPSAAELMDHPFIRNQGS